MVDIKKMVADLVQSEGSMTEVMKLTGDVVKKAACKHSGSSEPSIRTVSQQILLGMKLVDYQCMQDETFQV